MIVKNIIGEVEDCIVFGISSITGRGILFHAIMENGAIFYRLPISAFIQRGFQPESVPIKRLDELQLWEFFFLSSCCQSLGCFKRCFRQIHR